MTMMQKVQAKKSKKGFTLVELVIVIAILAILAAIAIPVITTTINSSKMSVMESDTATVNMLVKEAINNRLAKISTTTYNTKPATDEGLLVDDVLFANNLDPEADDFYSRDIGGKTYAMTAYGDSANGTLTIVVTPEEPGDDWKAPEGDPIPLSSEVTIPQLAKAAGLEATATANP